MEEGGGVGGVLFEDYIMLCFSLVQAEGTVHVRSPATAHGAAENII